MNFGVRRFDRASGNRRYHIHTFANLIHVNFRIPSTDGLGLRAEHALESTEVSARQRFSES